MGRDGKLTRSLLPGALGTENKERRIDKEKEIKRGREEVAHASHRGDRLARGTLCASLLPVMGTI